MKTSLCLVRNEILGNMSSLDLNQKEKGKLIGVCQQTVSRILQKLKSGQHTSPKRVGAKPRLDEKRLAELPNHLSKKSEFYGFEGDFWTHKRVKYVIEKEFNVVYSVKQVGRILEKIGWTHQKPQKKITGSPPKK